jgi:serine/threonine-protein kinase
MKNEEHCFRNWKEKWTAIGNGEGGGQGDVKIVVRSDGSNTGQFFLKVLRHQKDQSRRSRMFREVSAYRTLKNQGIPRLVDSNADMYENLDYKMYLVTEFISGCTLQKYIEDNGPLKPRIAIKLVSSILEIVDYCHSEETIHRDIKPANVMLRESSLVSPVLVDFGLSFNVSNEEAHATSTIEEMGNRFLRLPELAPMSPGKHDPRSDICFVCGLLLFSITGEAPVQLVNERSQMPHQRQAVQSHLRSLLEPVFIEQLLLIFDRGFQLDPAMRWQSARELRLALENMVLSEREPKEIRDARWKRIDEYTKGPDAQTIAHRSNRLSSALNKFGPAKTTLGQRLGNHFILSISNHVVDADEGVASVQMAYAKSGVGNQKRDWITFEHRFS